MTNKELQNLAENCGFGITEVHHAFYEKNNEFTEFARQIAAICATIAANTNSEISLQIKKEFDLWLKNQSCNVIVNSNMTAEKSSKNLWMCMTGRYIIQLN